MLQDCRLIELTFFKNPTNLHRYPDPAENLDLGGAGQAERDLSGAGCHRTGQGFQSFTSTCAGII